jgi:aspartate/tyrosine/aromatic aminotransferase
MAIQIEAVSAWYRGKRYSTVRLMVGGRAFDLGMADSVRAVEAAAAKDILRNLYDATATEPDGVDAFLDEVAELVAKAQEFTGWREPVVTDRVFGKRRRTHTWRAN